MGIPNMPLTLAGVKLPTLAATVLGSAILSAAILSVMSSATSSRPSVPTPRDRPQLIEHAPIRPMVVRSIPIVKIASAASPPPAIAMAPAEPEWEVVPPAPLRTHRQAQPEPAGHRPRAFAERSDPVERNVCTRHRMRKVYTNGGRSWRCRR